MKILIKTVVFAVVLTGFLSAENIIYDIAIFNGTVYDPESNTSDALNIGISEGKISYIGKNNLEAKNSINASGLIVSPGFIDILSGEPNDMGELYKAADGVTTVISMNGVSTVDIKKLFIDKEKMLLNFGAAVSQRQLRTAVGLLDSYGKPTGEQISKMSAILETALTQGALGLNLNPKEIPGTTYEEAKRLLQVVKKYNCCLSFTLGDANLNPTNSNANNVSELVDLCNDLKLPCLVSQVNEKGDSAFVKQALEIIKKADESGQDISVVISPYNYFTSYLASNRFAGEWQKKYIVTYSDLQVVGVAKKLTKEKYQELRFVNPLIAVDAIPEENVYLELRSSLTLMGSNAIIEDYFDSHPKAAGNFSRLFGKYVRDESVITMMDAIKKCTLSSAKKLENISSVMKNKGRIKEGADADITIFNPGTIKDKSTILNPKEYSEGISWVIVNGILIKDKNEVLKDVYPGKAIKRDN